MTRKAPKRTIVKSSSDEPASPPPMPVTIRSSSPDSGVVHVPPTSTKAPKEPKSSDSDVEFVPRSPVKASKEPKSSDSDVEYVPAPAAKVAPKAAEEEEEGWQTVSHKKHPKKKAKRAETPKQETVPPKVLSMKGGKLVGVKRPVEGGKGKGKASAGVEPSTSARAGGSKPSKPSQPKRESPTRQAPVQISSSDSEKMHISEPDTSGKGKTPEPLSSDSGNADVEEWHTVESKKQKKEKKKRERMASSSDRERSSGEPSARPPSPPVQISSKRAPVPTIELQSSSPLPSPRRVPSPAEPLESDRDVDEPRTLSLKRYLPISSSSEPEPERVVSKKPKEKGHQFSDASRQNKARREFRASDAGHRKKIADIKGRIAGHRSTFDPLLDQAKVEARRLCDWNVDARGTPVNVQECLLEYVNLVRDCCVSLRYPLTPASDEWKAFAEQPETTKVLLQAAVDGFRFNPDRVSKSILNFLRFERADSKVGKKEKEEDDGESGESSDSDEAQFEKSTGPLFTARFYTRSTPPMSAKEMVKHLEKVEDQNPSNYLRCQVLKQSLQRLDPEGDVRLFYSGYTLRSPVGREIEDTKNAQGGRSFLFTFKRVTGLSLRVYHWPQLDRPDVTKYQFRTDKTLSGREEVLVDVFGGPLLSLNSQPGGFATRIRYHSDLIPINQKLQEARQSYVPDPALQRPAPPDSSSYSNRKIRVLRDVQYLRRYAEEHSQYCGHIAKKETVAEIAKIATTGLEQDKFNAPRVVLRDELPREAILVPDKLYTSFEVGRGARNDRYLDEEAQGLVDLSTGRLHDGATYQSHELPMRDVSPVSQKQPRQFNDIFALHTSLYIHNLQPKYLVLVGTKAFQLARDGIFTNIASPQTSSNRLQRAFDTIFTEARPEPDEKFFGDVLRTTPLPSLPGARRYQPNSKTDQVWSHLLEKGILEEAGRYMIVQCSPLASSFRVTVPQLHGGGHEYNALLRPFFLRFGQAVQLRREVLEIVTRPLVVDGSREQAEAIMRAAAKLSRDIGLDGVLDKLFQEVAALRHAYSGLKREGQHLQTEQEAPDSERKEAVSLQTSQAVQGYNADLLVAVGAKGSQARLDQVFDIISRNRQLINQGSLRGVVITPDFVTIGPCSTAALLWMVFEVDEGKTYKRTCDGAQARGGTNVSAEAALLDFKKRQLTQLGNARARWADVDTCALSSAAARESMRQQKKGVTRVTCPHCDWEAYVKRDAGQEFRFRHACSVFRREDMIDLEALKKEIQELEGSIAAHEKSKKKQTSSTDSQLKVWSADGAGGAWPGVQQDPSLQSLRKQILDGKVKESGFAAQPAAKDDRVEKHGRLLFEDMIKTKVYQWESYARLPTLPVEP